MKYQYYVLSLLFLFFAQTVLFAQNMEKINQELAQIEERAKEIEPFLSSDRTILGVPITDRFAWERLAALPESKKIIAHAEALLKTSIPEASESLYKEYYRNGNRSNYQVVFARQRSRLSTFALAEAMENKGRFLSALEETIRFICTQPSWLLPAHDRNGEIYDGKTIYSDLVSTNLGCELGIIQSLFENSFSSEINELIIKNIEARILAPYEKSVKKGAIPQMWWVRTTNNWNSVCHAGTIGAALSICPSVERRAWFIAASEYYTKNYFFAGFTDDGYCSEGMSYWNYGFGHFIYLAAMICQATHNQVDLFQIPKVVSVSCFAPKLEIVDDLFAAFADCPINAKPDDCYVAYMSRMFQLGFEDYEKRGLGTDLRTGDLLFDVAIGFDILNGCKQAHFSSSNNASDNEIEPSKSIFSLPIRTEFEMAGVWIFRPFQNDSKNRLALALKGGSNSEHHNHNDVGTYSLVLVPRDAEKNFSEQGQDFQTTQKSLSRFMVIDPGAEIYTARTFGSRRYEGQLLNSFGHPVPRINRQLQKKGADAKGIVIEKSTSDQCDKIVLDISSAYDVPELDSLQRTFIYRRAFSEFDPLVSNKKETESNILSNESKEDNEGENQQSAQAITKEKPSVSLEQSEKTLKESEEASLIVSDSIQFKQGQPGIFESAIISFEPYEIETDESGTISLKNEPLTILVQAIDDKNNKLSLKWEKAVVGENDDSVPQKPIRYAFQVNQNIDKAQIDFLFILDNENE